MGRAPLGGMLAYFALTFAVTWSCFLAVAGGIPARSAPGRVLIQLGAWAPAIVAIVVAWRFEGRPAVADLVGRVFRWRVAARWYLFAALYTAAIKLAAALVHRAAFGAWPPFGDDAPWLIALSVALSAPFQAGEEVGWRGFALPRLAERVGFAPASLVLGLVWASWHLPQFFIREADTYGQSFAVYALQVVALSVTMAWLTLRAGGSLLPVMLLHSGVNNSKDIVPSALPGGGDPFGLDASRVAWITVTLLWIVAAGLLARMPWRRSAGPDDAPLSRPAAG